MRVSKAGYSLVSVMVVTALGGIVAVMIMSLIDNVTKVMVRGNVADALEGTVRTVAAVLGSPDQCHFALRGATSGDKIVYNVQDNPPGPPPGGNEVDIENIFAQNADATVGATPVISTTVGSSLSMLSGGVVITSIRFRERTRQVGRGSIRRDGATYDTYAGEIEIVATPPGGAAMRRVLPYTAVVDRTTRTIEFCYIRDTSMQNLCEQMGGTYDPENGTCEAMINAGTVRCDNVCAGVTDVVPVPPEFQAGGYCVQGCPAVINMHPDDGCVRLFHLLGFDYDPPAGSFGARSWPMCACTPICFNKPRGRIPIPPPTPRSPPPRPPPSN